MELLDTFDIDGNFVGVKSREFCHEENPQVFHKAVWIWIKNNNGEILVQKRAKSKKKSPNKWDMPSAGHVATGETCLLTCVRETQEELGIDCKEDEFVFLKQFINLRGWELVQVYLLKKDIDINNITLQPEEVAEVKWLNYNDFVNLIYSDDFCNHAKEYKDWVCKILK